MDKNILVTGGAGYIATHTEVELLNRGFNVIAFDNMVNSCDESIKRVEKITGKKIKFYNADMRDRTAMKKIFARASASRWNTTITIFTARLCFSKRCASTM